MVFLKSTPDKIKSLWIKYRYKKILTNFQNGKVEWNEKVKRSIILNEILKAKIDIFIETGTYRGATSMLISRFVKQVQTIELSVNLFNEFNKYLTINRIKNILPHQGESINVLTIVLPTLNPNSKILFWLDAHYSGLGTEIGNSITPIKDEINLLKNFTDKFKNIIILIDDIRLFNGSDNYPDIEEFKQLLSVSFPRYNQIFVGDVLILKI